MYREKSGDFREGNSCNKSRNLLSFNQKGQVTIFIIVAVLIVAAAVLIYFLVPGLRVDVVFDETSPQEYIQICIEEDLRETIEEVSLQGGSLNPQPSLLWQNHELQYLCYTNGERERCVVHIPFVKSHLQSEVESDLEESVRFCFNGLKDEYERTGYDVSLREGETIMEILPGRIELDMDYEITVTKDDRITYDDFVIILNSNLYELMAISQHILDWEARHGDANCGYYMENYRDIKCSKPQRDIEGTVYVLESKETGEIFQFASRSLVLGPFR